MLTTSDIKKLTEVFATKLDLAELKEELTEKMVTKAEFREAITTLDGIAGELKNMRGRVYNPLSKT